MCWQHPLLGKCGEDLLLFLRFGESTSTNKHGHGDVLVTKPSLCSIFLTKKYRFLISRNVSVWPNWKNAMPRSPLCKRTSRK